MNVQAGTELLFLGVSQVRKRQDEERLHPPLPFQATGKTVRKQWFIWQWWFLTGIPLSGIFGTLVRMCRELEKCPLPGIVSPVRMSIERNFVLRKPTVVKPQGAGTPLLW